MVCLCIFIFVIPLFALHTNDYIISNIIEISNLLLLLAFTKPQLEWHSVGGLHSKVKFIFIS